MQLQASRQLQAGRQAGTLLREREAIKGRLLHLQRDEAIEVMESGGVLLPRIRRRTFANAGRHKRALVEVERPIAIVAGP